ncbi:MAG TPA: hypothetical protein ENK33_03545 [Desulfobacterales bacterium]|nr:hypothetical protein [Desulfobacterales bacterium]
MLCPKCGYISFDSLDSCPSCNQDLAATRKTLNGTAIMVEEQYFLGSIYGDNDQTIQQSTPPEEEYDEQSAAESTPESDESTPLDDAQDEISFDLGEMPPLDQSSLDLSADPDSDDWQKAEGSAALMDNPSNEELSPAEPESGISLEPEPAALNGDDEELPPENISGEDVDAESIISESPLPETKDEDKNDDQLTLDIDSLSLEIDDIPLEEAAEPAAEAAGSEAMSLDLEQIDLSDLVHAPQPASSGGENSAIPQADESLDIEDVKIDEQELTLESLEPESGALELEFDQDNQEVEKASLEPIDLSLDIESAPEELDLSLDEIVATEEK